MKYSLDESIRNILNETWDPIEVFGVTTITDEYDEFIPRIIKLVNMENISIDIFYDMLSIFEKELSAETTDETKFKTARLLMEISKQTNGRM